MDRVYVSLCGNKLSAKAATTLIDVHEILTNPLPAKVDGEHRRRTEALSDELGEGRELIEELFGGLVGGQRLREEAGDFERPG